MTSQPADDSGIKPLRSLHTNSLTAILSELGISLAISAYQASKLIIVRADGETTNTHFRVFDQPMGLVANRDKLTLGTAYQIIEFWNVPAAAQKIEPQGKHDGCYIPRRVHTTGDIDIHEMAWAADALWFVNTRFSCLCTLDARYSFVPRWRPPFVSAYEASDRTHLNGLAIRDDAPRYVTALGNTDTPNGWRGNKANGGILMDIATNETICQGLSMPHSPRWYRDQLWVLESGKGSLATVDIATGMLTTVATLPGFTRGIDFYGDLAFIGLSQVRESAVFSGIPITKTLTERICGVWVVNITTGETVAYLKFEETVQEIFGISVLPGLRFPEVIETDEQIMGSTFVLPDEALAEAIQPDVDKEVPQTYFKQGIEYYTAGQKEEAISAFFKCLELQPDYLPARYNLGVTLSDLKQYPQAISQLTQVTEAEASHAEAHNSLGYIYSNMQQLDKALYHYEQALKIQPEYGKAKDNLRLTRLQAEDNQ